MTRGELVCGVHGGTAHESCTRCKLAAVRRLVAGAAQPGATPGGALSPSPSSGQRPPYAPAPLRELPCVHEGPVREYCKTCSGAPAEAKHVRDCSHPDNPTETCTRDHPQGAGWKCSNCPHYVADAPPITQRHLLYHIYPVTGNGTWQRNVAELRKRLSLFNGRRAVAVVTGPGLDSPETVRAAFEDFRIDSWLTKPNNRALREVATWPDLWAQVATLPGATFYGHAKGVTHPVNPGVSIHRWADLLYAGCLDYWPVVEELLKRHPVAGCLKKSGHGFKQSAAPWHYSGSFYWVRHATLGTRWKTIDAIPYGVESWPGLHWREADAGVIFGAGRSPSMDLYQIPVLESYEREFEAWKSKNTHRRSATG